MHQPYHCRMGRWCVVPALLVRGGQSYQTLSRSVLHCPAKLQGNAMCAQEQ